MTKEMIGAITIVFYLIGLGFAVVALSRSRTPQGAAAWIVGLLGFPFIAVPAFLVFGRNRFFGYVKERREFEGQALKEVVEAQSLLHEEVKPSERLLPLLPLAAKARQVGFTGHNHLQLLIDGEETYASLLAEIEKAQKYILFQFYVVREDPSGFRFREALVQKAKAGVKIYFLYDQVGTELSPKFIRVMTDAGIEVRSFESTKKWSYRFQINFRNHRKVVVVDGKTAFVGGLNIGDDYLGLWESIGHWRDTHLKLEGPAAKAAQVSFMKDWYWTKEEIPDLDWTPHQSSSGSGPGSAALVLHTGPADDSEVCLLAHLALIHSAKKSIWISNPYFVPPEGLANALSLAVLRGVDVNILVPGFGDNLLVALASKPHVEKILRTGVKFFQYRGGFLHQKIMLIDEEVGLVGSANFDSRSFFINFEVMAISEDQKFVSDLKKALENDLKQSEDLTIEHWERLPFWRKTLSRAANLLSPML